MPVVPDEERKKIVKMLKAVLEKGRDYQEQYGKGWLKPVHLFGAVCNEAHRQCFAATVLLLLGKEEQLQEALVAAAPAAVGGRVSGVQSAAQVAAPQGWVQEELIRRLREELPTLPALMRKWGLGHKREWLFLASTPPQAEGFAFTQAECPELYAAYISMLFVGLSDNNPVVRSPPPSSTPICHVSSCV